MRQQVLYLWLSEGALDTPVVGTEGGLEFTRAILGDEDSLDIALAREVRLRRALQELLARLFARWRSNENREQTAVADNDDADGLQ